MTDNRMVAKSLYNKLYVPKDERDSCYYEGRVSVVIGSSNRRENPKVFYRSLKSSKIHWCKLDFFLDYFKEYNG